MNEKMNWRYNRKMNEYKGNLYSVKNVIILIEAILFSLYLIFNHKQRNLEYNQQKQLLASPRYPTVDFRHL